VFGDIADTSIMAGNPFSGGFHAMARGVGNG
jgi:hypothetical protein